VKKCAGNAGRKKAKQHQTALETLSAGIPSNGLQADVTVVTPWEVPNWKLNMKCMGIVKPQDRKKWVDGLYKDLPTSGTTIINTAATLSNKGRSNRQVVAAATATEWVWGKEVPTTKIRAWCLGTKALQHDANMFVLMKAAEWLVSRIPDALNPPKHFYITDERPNSSISDHKHLRARQPTACAPIPYIHDLVCLSFPRSRTDTRMVTSET
jgi:hypothetical protein